MLTCQIIPSNGLKMANAILATGPVISDLSICTASTFIGGITVGAVKG